GSLDAERADALADGAVEIGAARLDARVSAEPIPAGLDFGADFRALRFDPQAGAFAIDGLATRLAGITAEWRLDARDVIDAPQVEGELAIADAAIGPALETFGLALPEGLEPAALGSVGARAELRLALSVADAADASAAAPALGPWRIDELRLDSLAVDILGAALRGEAALGDDGVLRARLDVAEHAPSDALRALAAAHVPAGIELAAIDRIGLSGRVELGLADGRFAVRDLRASLLGAELAAALDAVPADDGPGRRLRGTFSTTQVDPERLARLLGEHMPAAISPAELGTLAVAARYEYDPAARRIALDDVALEALGLASPGRAVIAGLGERVAASGDAAVAPFSPRALMRRFGQEPPATSDPTALQRAALTARFDADGEGGRFRDIELT